MKRKAIQLANNTLVVSLPAAWARNNNITKGADLDVEPKESMLVIHKSGTEGTSFSSVRLDISGMSESLVWNYVESVYRRGFSEIEIFFSDSKIQNIKDGSSRKTLDVLSRIADTLVGMEILRQTRNSCVIREISQLSSEEYPNVLNRIFLSLITMSGDVIEAVKAKDKETIENIFTYSEINVNKLSNYCMRILNTCGLKDFKESNSHYVLTFLLEDIGDMYARIARVMFSGRTIALSDGVLKVFEGVNRQLALCHRFILKPGKEYYLSYHAGRNDLKKEMTSLLSNSKGRDTEVLFILKSILDRLMEAANAKLTSIEGL
ncbi:AbrB/MazE/SpoVT family DNA-binding domain-containing protein [Candidatus Woesearchaeota archaeon]|nr:AbrB/MazE/SpoVT family DNA-binding domain-containing protein [Candidatus Woesearchaeota archaeon]